MREALRDRWLWTILVAFLILGNIYGVVTPLFEASDEMWHYPVVKHIADGEGLPVQDPGRVQPWRQEGSQPPLYYALAALTTFWIDTSDLEELLWLNPHAQVGVPLAYRNKNMVVHTMREAFPYRGTVLAVHLIRFLSLFLGAGTVLFTYLLAQELFPSQRVLALGTAAITAFNPMFLFITASVDNDSLVVFLSSLALLLLIRWLRDLPSERDVLLSGLVIALVLLTKVSALGLLPLAFVVLGYLVFRQRSLRFLIRSSLLISLPILLLASWWFIRNWTLYGDPLGLRVMVAIAGPREKAPGIWTLFSEFEGLRISYWALFGGVNILAHPWVYRFFDALSLLSLAGLIMAAIRRLWDRVASLTLLALWVAILLAGLLRWTQLTKASSGRLLFPGIAALSLFLAWGLQSVGGRRYGRWLLALVGGVMLTVAALSPFLYIAPAYAKPPRLPAEEVGSIPNPIEVDYGGAMRLLGSRIEEKEVRPGEWVHITLWWQALTKMERDYSVYVKVFGPDKGLMGQVDTYPGGGNYPTSLWEEGEVIEDIYGVQIERSLLEPRLGLIEVGVYPFPSLRPLEASDPRGQPLDWVIVGRVKIALRNPLEYAISHPTSFNLGDQIQLIGYGLEEELVHPGETIHLTLYWRARQVVDKDYTIFTHLIDDEERLWGQKDNQPAGGTYPTSFWDEGEVVKDEYELVVKGETPPGEYLLEVGMYLAETGERLLVYNIEGELLGDRTLLPTVIEVAP